MAHARQDGLLVRTAAHVRGDLGEAPQREGDGLWGGDDGIGQVVNPTFDEDDNWLHQYQYGPP